MKYKFRAECIEDVFRLFSIITSKYIKNFDYKFLSKGFPDVEVEGEFIDINIDELRDYIRKLDDCHVILQTVNYVNEYTGNRDYNIT